LVSRGAKVAQVIGGAGEMMAAFNYLEGPHPSHKAWGVGRVINRPLLRRPLTGIFCAN
jgi:hypothetical protein